MGTPLNSSDEEYVPAINASEDVMVFTYKGVKSKGGKMNSFLTPDPQGAYTEDLYISKKEKGKFSAPEPLEEINTTAHDACVSISLDGQLLYFYRNTADDHGDLYQAQVSGQGFSKPKKLKGYVNSYAYEGHCSLSPDGNTLYFTSDRSGGYGGVDIYRATMLPDSSWGNIVNLGDSINTPYDEDAPFIHPDGVSLFYSSKGRNSMGGYDIFKATMNVKDSSFKKVQHLGYPINSTDDDIYFVVAANGERAYYSSAKQDGQGLKDIYMIDTKFEGLKPALMLVKGTTKRKGMAVGSNNQIKIISQSGKVYKNFTSNNSSGEFMVSVPAGEKYKFVFKDELGNFKEFDFDLTSLNAYKEENLDVNFDAMTVANSTPTVAASNTDAAVNTNTIKPSTVGSTTFVPNNIAQATSLSYAKENGNVDVGAQGIQFRVQIAALKYPKAMNFPYLKNCGKIETLLLVDGITRVTIGGKFTTLNDALKHNKKVIDAGQKDAFITAIYQNKRMLLEELVNMGIFKPQKVD
jgi:Tol biopolymer transport system component